MKLVPENISESIKHLKPRSEEELAKLPKPIAIKEDTYNNFEVYEHIVARKPFVKDIIEHILGINPRYQIHFIREEYNEVTLWFYQSMAISFRSQENINLLMKHRVYIQCLGKGDEYSFSVSIKD